MKCEYWIKSSFPRFTSNAVFTIINIRAIFITFIVANEVPAMLYEVSIFNFPFSIKKKKKKNAAQNVQFQVLEIFFHLQMLNLVPL